MANETFGQRLKRLRESAGLSQQQLATAAGLTQKAISFYETDKRSPDFVVVERLASALGVAIQAFAAPPADPDPPGGGARGGALAAC
jgi:transcriptional regulator with XRE-family HTH domain